MYSDVNVPRYRSKDQRESGKPIGNRENLRQEHSAFSDGISPVGVHQEEGNRSREFSTRSRDKKNALGIRSSSHYARETEDSGTATFVHSRSKPRKEFPSTGGRSSSSKPKTSFGKSKGDLQHFNKGHGGTGEPTYKNVNRYGSDKAYSRGSEASFQSGKSSFKPGSSGDSSITGELASGKRSSRGKAGKKKLDAKVFALSMELIEHVSKGRLELAEKKIKQGASPDYADYDKRTPLHLAASEGHVELVNLLLEYGANPDVEDRWGSKPYDDALKHNNNDIADVLRKYCQPDDENTLRKEHHDGLELLELCARGLEKLVRDKIAAGAKTKFADYDKRTPLHLAACEGHAKIAEILLNNGADATMQDRFGHTPVDDAMRNGFLNVLEVMAKKGVEMPLHIFDKSYTPEFQRNMRLIDVSARGKIGMVQKLLQEGADAKFQDYDLRTPLHLACAEGHLSIVRLLIAAGADVSAEDRWSTTAIEEAIKNEHNEVVSCLEDGAAGSPAVTTMG